MTHLIGNDLNQKAIVNNIMRKAIGKVILLSGPFGTGKTDFATQIAHMLTCDNLTEEGICGECEGCKEDVAFGLNNFNARIQLLNMELVTYEDMQHLVIQSTQKYRNKSEVYILDEFHLVDKKSQEILLAETAKLKDCYIIMTTTDKRSISPGIISRAVQINMRSLTPLESKALIQRNFPGVSDKVVQALIRKVGGSPRELINMSQYYYNSGLDDEDIVDLIRGSGNDEVTLCLEALKTRDVFFECLKTVRSMPDYMIKISLQDILWTYLGATPAEKSQMEYLAPFNETQIIKFLNLSNENASLTLLKMFQHLTVKPHIREENLSTHSIPPKEVTSEGDSSLTKPKRW